MSKVITPRMAILYEQDGVPFGFTIKKCQDLSLRINWIMELNIALWRGFSVEKFMTLLTEELRFTDYSVSDQTFILETLKNYISQREEYTIENQYFVFESKKLAGL